MVGCRLLSERQEQGSIKKQLPDLTTTTSPSTSPSITSPHIYTFRSVNEHHHHHHHDDDHHHHHDDAHRIHQRERVSKLQWEQLCKGLIHLNVNWVSLPPMTFPSMCVRVCVCPLNATIIIIFIFLIFNSHHLLAFCPSGRAVLQMYASSETLIAGSFRTSTVADGNQAKESNLEFRWEIAPIDLAFSLSDASR